MARPRGFDEAKVLATVRDLFWRGGYAGTSVGDLVATTGLGKGSLYGAFGSKRELFLRVLDDYAAQARESARAALEGPESGAWWRLRAWLFAAASDSTGARRGCFLARSASELAGRDPQVSRRALATYRAIEDLLVACIAQAQRHGDLPASGDARKLGALLFAFERGIESLARAGGEEAQLRSLAESALASLG
jgi:TetR/AcrR family transcriptional regulator, transcriptional repressor for nem operon